MGSYKYNKLVNITPKEADSRSREQTTDYHWGVGGKRGKIEVGDEEEQTIMYERKYCTPWGIGSIFYNSSKCNKTFKICESLCLTFETYIFKKMPFGHIW